MTRSGMAMACGVVCGVLAGLGGGVGTAEATVYPTTGHANYNTIPFGQGNAAGVPTMHQVFASSLFWGATGGRAAEITSIGFAVNPSRAGTTFLLGQVTINMGYTSRVPGQASPVGLSVPLQGGGGSPNVSGAMTTFYSNPSTVVFVATGGPENFAEMVFTGTPFVYDPNLGNLLVEIVVPSPANTAVLDVSRSGGSAESSRAFAGVVSGSGTSTTTALRMDFMLTPVGGGCEPDITTGAIPGQAGYLVPNGIVNNDDFFAFLIEFSAGNLAVADVTTTAIAGSPGYGVPNGIVNNDDFFYYLIVFSAGC